MKQDTLKKAKELEEDIRNCDGPIIGLAADCFKQGIEDTLKSLTKEL